MRRKMIAPRAEPKPVGPIAIWHGIECPEPPPLRDGTPHMLAMAQWMLGERERKFPLLVEQGGMTADEAKAELSIFADIAADWQWIATGEGQPARADTLTDRRDALDASIAAIANQAREKGGFSERLNWHANLVIAMRWHIDPARDPHRDIYWLARLNHQLRAEAIITRDPSQQPERIAA